MITHEQYASIADHYSGPANSHLFTLAVAALTGWGCDGWVDNYGILTDFEGEAMTSFCWVPGDTKNGRQVYDAYGFRSLKELKKCYDFNPRDEFCDRVDLATLVADFADDRDSGGAFHSPVTPELLSAAIADVLLLDRFRGDSLPILHPYITGENLHQRIKMLEFF